MECAICLEAAPRHVNVCKLAGGHDFHDVCIGVWSLQNETCPMCREPIRCQHRQHRKQVFVKQNKFLLKDNLRLMAENEMLNDRLLAMTVQIAEMSSSLMFIEI